MTPHFRMTCTMKHFLLLFRSFDNFVRRCAHRSVSVNERGRYFSGLFLFCFKELCSHHNANNNEAYSTMWAVYVSNCFHLKYFLSPTSSTDIISKQNMVNNVIKTWTWNNCWNLLKICVILRNKLCQILLKQLKNHSLISSSHMP